MKKPTQNESIAMMTTSAGRALEYSRQALAVLDMWIDTRRRMMNWKAFVSRRFTARSVRRRNIW